MWTLLKELRRYAESSSSILPFSEWSVSKDISGQVKTPTQKKLLRAFKRLQGCVCEGTSLKGETSMADVFIAFDEAHLLRIIGTKQLDCPITLNSDKLFRCFPHLHYSHSSFPLLTKLHNFCHTCSRPFHSHQPRRIHTTSSFH